MSKEILIKVSDSDFKHLAELGRLMGLDELAGDDMKRFSELRKKIEASFYIHQIAVNAAKQNH